MTFSLSAALYTVTGFLLARVRIRNNALKDQEIKRLLVLF